MPNPRSVKAATGLSESPSSTAPRSVEEGMQVALALVDDNERYIGRKMFTIHDGKITGDRREDLGDAPAALNAALAGAISEVESHVASLINSGKLNF
jgi:hypothetical protein